MIKEGSVIEGITVAEILREASVVDGGCDDTIWLIRSTSEQLIIIGTNYGTPCIFSVGALEKKIDETEASLSSLEDMLFDIKANNNDRNE